MLTQLAVVEHTVRVQYGWSQQLLRCSRVWFVGSSDKSQEFRDLEVLASLGSSDASRATNFLTVGAVQAIPDVSSMSQQLYNG